MDWVLSSVREIIEGRGIMKGLLAVTLAAAILGGIAPALAGRAARCAHCQCACHCRKVCRLVHEEKKVEIQCWGCLCEDFCVAAGPSCCVGEKCETVCDHCDATGKSPFSAPKAFVWRNWLPGTKGADVFTRKKLMRRSITLTVPSHKWVVEELCPACAARCDDAISVGAGQPVAE